MIKAVIFDFGNVICRFSQDTFVLKLAEYTRKDEECFRQLFRKPTELINRYETGLISSDEFYEEVLRLTGTDIPRDVFIEAFVNIFSPIEPIWILARKLRETYTLALLSNTNEWHYEYGIRQVAIFGLFSRVCLSYKVRKMKPDPAIYLECLKDLGAEARECVFIDDQAVNIAAASRLGIHGIQYGSHQDLEDRLSALGVAV